MNQKNNWKMIAIIFIVLFLVETFFIIWSLVIYSQIEQKTNECLYNVCSNYPEAWYENGVCLCYNYNASGSLVVDKEEYLK